VRALKSDFEAGKKHIILAVKDIVKKYPPHHLAIDHVSFCIEKGEFVFVVGRSGAGKTTLFRLLSRQENVDNGEIIMNGNDITKVPLSKGFLVRRELGVVYQDFKLINYKTVFENVAFALEIRGVPDKAIRRKVDEVLHIVDLKHRKKALPLTLSGGEQQRVAIARALVNRPAILLADEPTGNLDWETSWEILKLFMAINHLGTTIVMATHNEKLLQTMKLRTLVLDQGKKSDEIFY
jgi:cell division transport system ATP-binding protein